MRASTNAPKSRASTGGRFGDVVIIYPVILSHGIAGTKPGLFRQFHITLDAIPTGRQVIEFRAFARSHLNPGRPWDAQGFIVPEGANNVARLFCQYFC
jgi:hypothetical protein